MSSEPIKSETLRKSLIERRLAFPFENRVKANQAIQKYILQSWDDRWHTILIFVNRPEEVATVPLIKEWLSQNKRVCIPAFDKETKHYYPSELKDFEKETAHGLFGILEPKASVCRPISVDELNVIFVPGLAFDRRGNRLGYGYGYFDAMGRLSKAIKIGLAFSFQLVDVLIPHPGDVAMDRIITEKGVMECLKP